MSLVIRLAESREIMHSTVKQDGVRGAITNTELYFHLKFVLSYNMIERNAS
jgi:hypothetical protein